MAVTLCWASIGTPWTMFAQPTPHSSAATKLPTTVAHSHVARQRGESSLPQNSNETPRTISATRIRKKREVEAGEEARVPAGEGGERRAAGGQQPDLVAVPDRADRVDDRPLLGVVAADHAHQHADPEVEPLEHEVADPQHADQHEPEGLEEVRIAHQ